ncbi:alpha/beta fold hydrolase [Halomarina rubra]|uniref:Alpha/beta fold hydrolase n=1 Tax=Halomarina rubra TaxID=2071873 RepID=A0ABD6AX89_9EURY|nr:alpha/beta hydrolase [Halomarina rubra]
MSYVETEDGAELHYDERGDGDTVLLVHGWTMDAEYWWQKNVDVLAADHHVVSYDLRGHGRSEAGDGEHTLARYAADLDHLVGALDLDDVTLVGWSMGAAVVLTYVDRYGTDALRALVLADQSPHFYSEEGWEYPLFGEFSAEALDGVVAGMHAARAETVKPLLGTFFAVPPEAETVDEMYERTARTPTEAATAVLTDMARTDLRPALAAIDVPTLLCYGERSAVFPGDVGGWLEATIPDAELVRFEESGHCPQWEEPEKFNAELTAFVDRTRDRDTRVAGPSA